MKAHSFTIPQLFTSIFSCTFFLLTLFPGTGFAQFQKNYGTPLDNSFSKVVKDGTDYYVLGQDEPSSGALLQATVTRLDATGAHQWTLSLTIPSIWNDAILAPNGDLLVVGSTLPFDPTTQSLIGRVTSAGTFSCLRAYDEPGRDAFNRIVENPVPENAAFPYYILGTQNQPGGTATTEDVILINLDATCNFTFNWKKIYASPSDDEFFRDLDVLPNGDLLLAGNGASGLIFKTDNTGSAFNGVDIFDISFNDIGLESSGGLYAAANGLTNSDAHLLKFDQGLLLQWDVIIPQLSSVSQVWEGTPGEIYATGRGTFAGEDRAVIIKLLSSTPTIVWVKYLNAGGGFVGGSSWLMPNNEIAFTDARVISGGFGGDCAFISVSDLDLIDACLVSEDMATLVVDDPLPDGPVLPVVAFQDIPMGVDLLESAALNWLEDYVCGEPCEASFDITFVDSCGHIQVTSTSTGSQPIGYQWCSGESTPNFDVILPCGPHTFCVTVTCADGTTSTASQTIIISDNIPPIALCAPGVGVDLDANCMYNVTPGMIDGGSSDNCQIQSMSVSPTVLNGCGIFPITLTVVDWCGNTSTCMTEIQTIEVVPPLMTCPVNLTLACDNDLDPATTGFATAIDNCDPNPVVTYSDVISGQMPCDGLVTRTWTATDTCGNVSSCVQIITVFDNVPPQITNCPPSIMVNGIFSPVGICEADVQVTSPTATDNCDQSVTLINSFNNSGNASGIYQNGSTIVTWTATDDCGNTATCSFTIEVICDTLCPDNVVQNGMFSFGTPPGTDQSIQFATNWGSIWTGGSTGDFFNTTTALPPFSPPIPTAQGNFGAMWCRLQGSQTVWREGIMNELGTSISQNTGCYDLSFKLACLYDNPGPSYPSLSVFGVSTTGFGTGNIIDGNTPNNLGMFPAGTAVELGSYLIPAACDENYQIINFNFNSSTLPLAGITHIFFTRTDGISGAEFVAIDDVCLDPAPCPPDSCCTNLDAFCQAVENAVTISINPDSCKAIFSIGDLGDCDIYIDYVDWGVSPPQQTPGPLTSDTMVMFVYPASGTYEICYLAIEVGSDGFICNEKFICDTFDIICDSCCTGQDAFCQVVENAITISLDPDSCKAIVSIGDLGDCDIYIDYIDWGVSPQQQTPGPLTSDTMVMFQYPASGTYEICYLAIEVGSDGFICNEKFICDTFDIICDSCCTGQDAFCQVVENAITISLDPDSCKAIVSIGDLGDCDIYIDYIDWGVSPPQQTPGPLTSDTMVMFVYPASGTYEICYLAIEVGSDGFICNEKFICDTFAIICDSCCTDLDAFCLAVENAVTISLDPDTCKVIVNIGNLPDCDYFEHVNWGDGNIDNGPFNSDTMLMHVYPLNGTYIISLLAIELDDNVDTICFEKIINDTLELIWTAVTINQNQTYNIDLFPNPTTEDITLHFENGSPKNAKLEIIDIWGRTLAKQQLPPGVQDHKLSLATLAEGTYFVKITENGIPIWSDKIVKQ